MTHIIAVFKSRTQAADCYARLMRAGIKAGLINTPKQANAGCGLSVKLLPEHLLKANKIIKNAQYAAFYGYLRVSVNYGKESYGRL